MDELEFEVTPTDSGRWPRVRPLVSRRWRRPPRALTATLVALGVVLVTAALILSANPGLPGRLGVLLHGTPTPTPLILPGGNLLYVENALSWGQLSIDGQPVSLDQRSSDGSPIAQFLSRGVHTIIYRADPFPMLRCRLSMPASPSDTCPLDPTYRTFETSPPPARRALKLTPSLDALSAVAHVDLIHAVAAYLTIRSDPVPLPLGARYVSGDQTIVTASQLLTAQLTQQLAAASADPCSVLCVPLPDPNNVFQSPIADFVLRVHLKQFFTYSTPAGQTLLANGPISASGYMPNDGTVPLTLTWDGSWQMRLTDAQLYSIPACLAGARALAPYLSDPRDHTRVWSIAAVAPASNPAAGCLFRILASGAAYGAPPSPSAYVHILYRFGLVVTADDTSNLYLLSQLPRANADETAFARQLDAALPYN